MAKETKTAEPEVKASLRSVEKPVATKEESEIKLNLSKERGLSESGKARKASLFAEIITDCKDKGLITRERAAKILGVPQSKLGEK